MTGMSGFLLRIARWIEGQDRREWADAMQAEADSMDSDSTFWAVGCVAASVKERAWRERWFLAAIIGFPAADFVLRLLLFLPVVWAGDALGLPRWTFIAFYICLGLPFGFALGRLMPRRRAIAAALVCGLLLELAGIVQFWIIFGDGPEIWFEPGSQVYNLTPALGWAIGIVAWLIGAAAGSLTRNSTSAAEV